VYLQVVVDVGHVAPVAKGLAVGPLGLNDASVRAQHVSQVTVRCNKPNESRFYFVTKFTPAQNAIELIAGTHTHAQRITPSVWARKQIRPGITTHALFAPQQQKITTRSAGNWFKIRIIFRLLFR
jgi:hypothetical protein